jgi:hypothetical protein
LPCGVEQPPGYLAAPPLPVHRMKDIPDVFTALGIMDARCDVRRRRGLDPSVDLDFLKPHQHRFKVVAGRR